MKSRWLDTQSYQGCPWHLEARCILDSIPFLDGIFSFPVQISNLQRNLLVKGCNQFGLQELRRHKRYLRQAILNLGTQLLTTLPCCACFWPFNWWNLRHDWFVDAEYVGKLGNIDLKKGSWIKRFARDDDLRLVNHRKIIRLMEKLRVLLCVMAAPSQISHCAGGMSQPNDFEALNGIWRGWKEAKEKKGKENRMTNHKLGRKKNFPLRASGFRNQKPRWIRIRIASQPLHRLTFLVSIISIPFGVESSNYRIHWLLCCRLSSGVTSTLVCAYSPSPHVIRRYGMLHGHAIYWDRHSAPFRMKSGIL